MHAIVKLRNEDETFSLGLVDTQGLLTASLESDYMGVTTEPKVLRLTYAENVLLAEYEEGMVEALGLVQVNDLNTGRPLFVNPEKIMSAQVQDAGVGLLFGTDHTEHPTMISQESFARVIHALGVSKQWDIAVEQSRLDAPEM